MRGPRLWQVSSRRPLKVDYRTPEAVGILPGDLVDAVGDRLELVPAEARLDHDDPRVLGVCRNHLAREDEEIDHVTRDEGPAVGSRECELRTVGELIPADFVRADRIDASVPEQTRDLGRKVLVQKDPHPAETKRTSPGNSFSMTSGVNLAFASTWSRISSG